MADGLTHADVVDAALSLLETGGLPALAMRRIAQQLGVQQSALYWHIENKQALLAAVADEILSSIDEPADATWSSRVLDRSARIRAALLRYPDGADVVATTFAFRLGAETPFRAFTRDLEDAGLDADDAGAGASVLLHFIFGYTTNEQQHHQAAALGAIEPEGEIEGPPQFSDARFTRGVEIIVEGLDARRRSTASVAGS